MIRHLSPVGSAVAEEFPARGQNSFHCVRHDRFLVAGRAGYVASVASAIAQLPEHFHYADSVLNVAFCNILNFTVAVAAPHEPGGHFALPDTIVTRGVSNYAFSQESYMKTSAPLWSALGNYYCLINVAAWKLYRISKYSWAVS